MSTSCCLFLGTDLYHQGDVDNKDQSIPRFFFFCHGKWKHQVFIFFFLYIISQITLLLGHLVFIFTCRRNLYVFDCYRLFLIILMTFAIQQQMVDRFSLYSEDRI